MAVFKERPAPPCTFTLALATWAAAICRLIWPHLAEPVTSGVCLHPEAFFAPSASEWRRYLLHALWPLEPGYIRGFLVSTALLVGGYSLEHELGTRNLLPVLLGLHAAAAACALHLRATVCHLSLEPLLAAVAAVLHTVNPRVFTDVLEKRVPFACEPRWHMWALQSLLLLTSGDFAVALALHAAGVSVGFALALRDPEVWVTGWKAASQRSFGLGAAAHLALLLFGLLCMPLTAYSMPGDLGQALTDGRALRLSWWQASLQGSAPLLHMALQGDLSAEALFICKLMISFGLPLLLSGLRLWIRFYAGACVLLAMYSMNSPRWMYPHAGFLALCYLAWALWKMPSLAPLKTHKA